MKYFAIASIAIAVLIMGYFADKKIIRKDSINASDSLYSVRKIDIDKSIDSLRIRTHNLNLEEQSLNVRLAHLQKIIASQGESIKKINHKLDSLINAKR